MEEEQSNPADDDASWLVNYEQLAGESAQVPAEWLRSDDELREAIAAWQHDREWAPPWVGDDLEATAQEAELAHTDAQFLDIWAANDLPSHGWAPITREDIEYERGRAGDLTHRAGELERVGDARAFWYRATAHTRESAERANVELTRRGRPPTEWGAEDTPPGRVLSLDEIAQRVAATHEAFRRMEEHQAPPSVWEPQADGDDHGFSR